MPVSRYDIGTLKAPQKTPQGFLRVDAYLTRTGIFEYRDSSGGVRRELRLDNEVFDGNALDSFSMAPVTDDHPPAMLTVENAREYSRGHLSETVKRDGNFVRASMLITDAALIAKMENGKKQISCGYVCDLEMTPGEYRGQKYDAIQRNIRGNHVAVVDSGRAGPDVCVRMDSLPEETEKVMFKIRIDGVDYEVSEAVAQAFAKYDAERASVAARADVAETALAQEKAARKDAEDPAKFSARVQARVALEKTAGAILEGTKLDEMSDRDVKLAVIAKLGSALSAEHDDAYVNAYFDGMLKAKGSEPLAKLRENIDNAIKSDVSNEPADVKARREMITSLQNAWKTKGSK